MAVCLARTIGDTHTYTIMSGLYRSYFVILLVIDIAWIACSDNPELGLSPNFFQFQLLHLPCRVKSSWPLHFMLEYLIYYSSSSLSCFSILPVFYKILQFYNWFKTDICYWSCQQQWSVMFSFIRVGFYMMINQIKLEIILLCFQQRYE